MTKQGHPRRRSVLAAGVAVVGLVSVAAAQDGLGGKTLRVTVGQTLKYSDNIDLVANPTGDILRASSSVGLAYSDITRTQTFRFSTGGSYDVDSDGQTDLSDPYVQLFYGLEGANSRLNLSADYIRTNLDDAFSTVVLTPPGGTPGIDPVTGIALIEGGVRTNTDYAFGLETGLQSNIGFRLDLSERSRRYSQTLNPDLYATKDRRIGVLTTFRIDPQITARLTADARDYTSEDLDQTQRTETSVGAGVLFNVAPDMTLDLSLSQERIDVERLSGNTFTEGLGYAASLDRTLRNGTIGIDFTSDPTVNGRRSTLRANRAMSLPREGTLSYGIGVTKTDGLSAEPLFSLAYAQPLKLGRFGVELSQEARTDEEDDTSVIVTRLSANYAAPLTPTLNWSVNAGVDNVSTQGSVVGEDRRRINLRSDLSGQINDISSWSAGLTFSDTRTTSPGVSEQQRRYGLQMAYRREVAKDWDMVARYQHTTVLDTTAADRRSNAISLGLEKTFEFRP